ncbi:unnamed protein product [Miscanthus lutarioriparius]|uniref:Uncharacterized protein n=2 Tax=Poaceae TaxID=4479 RepID=A0A811SIB0_9POAL|nr:unnamed protein product [Miscanthus lutarioriparius]
MTTAARPTWAPAKGGNEQGGTRIFGPSQKYSSRDLAAHTSLKPRLRFVPTRLTIFAHVYRKDGQQTQEELQKRNLREELEERERKHYSSKDKSYAGIPTFSVSFFCVFCTGRKRPTEKFKPATLRRLVERTLHQYLFMLWLSDNLFLSCCNTQVQREAEDKIVPRDIDADDSDVEPKSDDESDEDDDDDDDTEALMAELERIKKERAEEKLRKERQQAEEEAKMKEAELMRGNPLININNPGSFSVKRRWDDDVIFKNQARGETKTPKRFINDTIRSDFHRKFLQRYMK